MQNGTPSEKTTTNEKSGVKGNLTFDNKVIQKIIGIALSEVDGGFFANVAEKLVNTSDVTSGIDVEVGKKQVAVDLDIVAEYGIDISKLYDKIKNVIVREVKNMTELEVIEVNVNVVDVKTKEQHEKDSTSLQDRVSDATDKTKEAISKGAKKSKETLGDSVDKVTSDNKSSRVN
ncbi:stress response regulator Gls24 [Fructilactobacillus lindneri]|uniref:Stress response regulator gls24 homolog n=2 Tax=Fructilactobacillus lindneri TaxID=53444 RepID=A0A0R2JZU7_9LACO|nr:Asp23/Gls24 family envelope stress response protein [Fructilactobacillus lindneri]ANZ57653.1 stress response regulator Gls24 [Fructilactobacillus lindneri]ANZ58923.1 stress response regulator Gls24 [Fructilactobacillus lindneri]KRN79533.1 general stress protein gls20 [Fructilactobacillus lindneri DSM 20690 = JCM 11027]POG98069.1 stress response regulator Gls24 [Fructilactobacillus lindneri]POH02400.1 stress response regulator Gls24 [Fructilactobacillus lindneri]